MERTTMRGIRSVCGEEVSDVVDRMPSSKLPQVIKEALTIVRDFFYPNDKEVQTAISECLSTNLLNRAELSKHYLARSKEYNSESVDLEEAGGDRERADLLFRRSAILYALSEYLRADAITLDLVDNVVYDLGHGCKKPLEFGALLGKRILNPEERLTALPAAVQTSEAKRGLTEAEWLESVKPTPMLAHVFRSASERKLRLFATACGRRIWSWLTEECRQAVEVAEKHADRQATQAALTRAVQAVRRLRDPDAAINTAQEAAAEAAACAASDKRNELVDTASNAAMCAAMAAGAAKADRGSASSRETLLKALAAEQAVQSSLL